MTSDSPKQQPIGVVVTHHPKLSQTFVRSEIDGLRAKGRPIQVFALNQPEAADLASDADRAEQASTVYLKANPRRQAGAALVAVARAARGGALREILGAARTGGADPSATMLRLFHLVEAAIVWNTCRAQGIRHIHAQFGGSTATIAMLAARLGRSTGEDWSFSFTVHGYTDFTDEPAIGFPQKVPEARFVVVISDFIRGQVLRQVAPEHWDKVRVIRVGIDPSRFPPRPLPHPVATPATMLTVGRLSSEKGHAILIDAVSILRGRGLDVALTIVGDGPLRSVLEDLAAERNVEDLITFTGALQPSRVAELLAETDIFCLASFAEGIPVSIMEAMAVGVPVVASDVMGITELVVDGVTGRTTRPGRADSFADAIEACLSDPEATASMIEAAAVAVRTHHDHATNLAEVGALFRQELDAS